MADEKHKFLVLDAIRGVAAAAVVCLHLHFWMGPNFFASGYLAVDVFFVLSGFVISFAFDKRFEAGMTAGRFAMLRYIRFCPMLFLGVLLGAIKIVSLAASGRAEFGVGSALLASIFNAFMVPFPLTGFDAMFPTNVALWTLFFEFLINVIYAATFRWLNQKVLWSVVLVSFAILASSYIVDSKSFFSLTGNALRTVFSFSLGVAIFRSRSVWSGIVPKLPATVVLCAVGLLLYPGVEGSNRVTYDLLFLAVASPLLIIAGSEARLSPRMLPIATWLGAISFPIYALNIPIRNLVPLRWAPMDVYNPYVAVALFVFVVGIGAPVEWYYDKKLRELLKRKLIDRGTKQASLLTR